MSKILNEEGLSFDDVLLEPRESHVLPHEVNIESRLSRNIKLHIPFVASPMDTVTDHKMAIAISRSGGVGIIHRRMPIYQQVEEVKRVKRYQSTIIRDPYTLYPYDTVEKARKLMTEKNISGIPIVNRDTKELLGIITKHDLQFTKTQNAQVSTAMTPRNSLFTGSFDECASNTNKARSIMQSNRVEKLPLIDGTGRFVGLITLKDILKSNNGSSESNLDLEGRLCVGGAIGVGDDFLERAFELAKAGCDVIVIDSSHGHSKNVMNALDKLKKTNVTIDIIVGNIATATAAEKLIHMGVDGLRVGIGPGSICITRPVTGCGVPQITAILEVANIALKYDIPFIADGGIRYSGDVTKALAAGASSVMIGSLFAGVEESPGEKFEQAGHSYKAYRGMGSANVGTDRYGAKAVPEGVEGMVPYKGTLDERLGFLIGGLRQGMGYIGSKTLKELHKFASFRKISHASVIESHVHDVIITREAPNYPTRLT